MDDANTPSGSAYRLAIRLEIEKLAKAFRPRRDLHDYGYAELLAENWRKTAHKAIIRTTARIRDIHLIGPLGNSADLAGTATTASNIAAAILLIPAAGA